MPRSWVCWWLLLGGALLLGQPGSGAEEGSSSAAEQDSREGEEGPSDPADISFWPHEETSEELEDRARAAKSRLEAPGPYDLRYLHQSAMSYFNDQHSGALYKEYVGTTVKFQKAFGVAVTLDLFLAETNCTKEEGLGAYPRYSFRDFSHGEPITCVPPPESEQEVQKCRFVILKHYVFGSFVINVYCERLIMFRGREQSIEDGEQAVSSMNTDSDVSSMNTDSEEAASSLNTDREEAASSMNASMNAYR